MLDTVDDALYNAAKRFGDIDLKPANLMDELAQSGVKYAKDEVVMVTKNSDGMLLWLENGSEKNGLIHIIQEHGSQFIDRGVSTEEIPELLSSLLDTKPVSGFVKDPQGFHAIFQWDGKYYRVGCGSNGFIKSFYPITPKRF